jgi:glycosyltransferase involved in cell wall biosynthesis
MVRRRDPAALAEAIVGLLGDPELRQRLGAAGRDDVITRFALDRLTGDIARLYRAGLTRSARQGCARRGLPDRPEA